MKSYEYSSIFTPQEFQNFARDIIQIKENKFIESFAEGKDGGIDGRFIDQEGNITILQVKRYKNMNVTILNTMKEEKIQVLALLPMELPEEIELDNTLEAMQKFVGGLIECITLSDTGSEVTLVCNDEGKLLGLPLNRPLWDGADVLAGPGFLAGCDNEGNLTSLPQSAMDFYKEKFRAFIIEI